MTPANPPPDHLAAAIEAIRRNKGQMSNSTPRRDRFTFDRYEMNALIAVLPLLRAVQKEADRG